MGWLKRLFGLEKPQNAQVNPTPQPAEQTRSATPATTETVPPERVGLNGEYDQSGLAKRVALAFDQDNQLDDIDTLWVAQTGSTVVLKGKVPSQDILQKMVSVASSVNGATNVDTSQVTVG
ncbi:phospholipid-binding protein [Scytonema sp. UIC 10036]|uniref:phospholipid-binding protein n=1 Tax=Scytonema sp. UIC 10036 TaxID=2304196 RepID=UPI0012DAD39C|nr:phospholipid-binding protein [Scytonema sp. UIC 10036]MUH01672.1 phospholipid-binding protein [Scytonema sp. UIC 10036]